MIKQQKIAQMAAYLLAKTGGTLPVLKLHKLLYLAEKESVVNRRLFMSGDCPVSMPHGPVLSQTLDLTNGAGIDVPGGWREWIDDREGYNVRIKDEHATAERSDFDYLSDADIGILDDILEQFGAMSQFELRDWTHRYCEEWEDPKGSSKPIPISRIFRAAGYSDDYSKMLAKEIEADQIADELFAGA